MWRLALTIFFFVAALGFCVVFVLIHPAVSVEPQAGKLQSVTEAQWGALVFLVIALILFLLQVVFSFLMRTFENWLIVLNIGLFVQASTLLTAVVVNPNVAKPEAKPWVLLFLVVAVFFELVLVLIQVLALQRARRSMHRRLAK